MAIYNNDVNTKAKFKEYCLRRLGEPVTKINVADEQVEDRIDDALQFYYEYHMDALQHDWLIHKVTEEDLENKYIEIDDLIINVVGIYPLASAAFPYLNAYSDNMFFNGQGANYIPGEGFTVGAVSALSYSMASIIANVQFARTVQDLYEDKRRIEFKRHMGRIHMADNFHKVKVDDYLMFEVYKYIDHNEFPKIWNDMWLKKYATQLIKRQWGDNLKKFEGVQMPGGVTLNGQKIWDEANEAITKLEEEMNLRYSEPPNFFIM